MQTTLTRTKAKATIVEEAGRAPAPQRLSRWSRATLLWAVLSFVLLQIGLRVGIDRWLPELRDPTFEIKARRFLEIIAEHPKPPVTVLMLGSSVTGNAFKAAYLEELLTTKLGQGSAVMNMANLGAGPLTELIWMRRLLSRGIRPDFVLVEFSPHLWNHTGPPLDGARFQPPLLNESDLDVVQRDVPDPELRAKWREARWLPAYGHRLTILNYLAHPIVPVQDQGPTWGGTIDARFWSALGPRSPEGLKAAIATMRVFYQEPLRHFSPGPASFQALQELLELLNKEKIAASVVMMPQGPTLRWYYPADKLENLIDKVTELTRQNGFTFVRAHEWLGEEMFADSVHPTTVGADVFSNRIARGLVAGAERTQILQLIPCHRV